MPEIRGLTKRAYLVPMVALLALGSVFVACGDDDDDETSSPTATSASASSPTRSGSPTQAAATQPSGQQIRVEDNAYAPDDATIKAGTEVTWTWAGERPHSVEGTFNGQRVASPTQQTGTFKFTFASAGTFAYQCGVHGQAMSGKITVQ